MGRKRKKMGWRGQLILAFTLITAVVFTPTSILLLVGMLPTMVAAFVDRNPERTKGMTVGAMNLAGCAPFVVDLWTVSNTAEHALQIITSPLAIIVMYSAAGIGYLIDWAVTGIVATFLMQKAKARLAAIEKTQAALAERWGPEVTGEIPLDAEGFPVHKPDSDSAPEAAPKQKRAV